ncbi:MarR family transcriptional regulator [Paenibacillus urinalis]|uniref:MarR family transcriptional regulator n=1 Tax=Paenibacillus urinalis TaxID=521520 RepID=A0AAX3N539_9BACL|nr:MULTISPECIES: MarR family transcriptional regulator [Paenibacillus]WDH84732.1 MarR family transcriptional regulator [Paenibacillus urinalis]WDH96191.1 MarR family transcriptional regulator [Paenibacillus urinalis]WDI04414.1 MarR family transcriptional regulator [Paenibacillus urinalis]
MNDYIQVVTRMNQVLDEFNVLITKEVKDLDDYNLTSQQEVILIYISKHERITANEISQAFDITKSAVSQVLTKLEQEKMILKQVNPDNRRESFIVLDEQGQSFITKLAQIDQVMIDKYYSKIDLPKLIQMTETMEEINKIIKKSKLEM